MSISIIMSNVRVLKNLLSEWDILLNLNDKTPKELTLFKIATTTITNSVTPLHKPVFLNR